MTFEMTFEQWMQEVDDILLEKTGFTHECLRDRRWRDAYDSDIEPLDAICELIADPDDFEAFMEEELWG